MLDIVIDYIRNHYTAIAICFALSISILFMIIKRTMNEKLVGQVALSSITLFPPIVLMLSSLDPTLLSTIGNDKGILFVSGFMLTLYIANDIKEKFQS